MSSVRNELESCSELFIHITGWSDSKRKILLDGKKLRNRTQITYVYLRYLQSKTAADSRELINRKFDFCQDLFSRHGFFSLAGGNKSGREGDNGPA